MARIKLIPISERSKFSCDLCRTKLSVKYMCTVDGREIRLCNKCALLYAEKINNICDKERIVQSDRIWLKLLSYILFASRKTKKEMT